MKILFICTHNRCRSILCEAITNHLAGELITARSAGSQPAGEVHPLTQTYLQQAGYPITGLRSQSWDDFEDFEPDLVITVCDSAAGETCPVYFGRSIKFHWGLADPSKLSGDAAQQEKAFRACIEEIEARAGKLRELANHGYDRHSLQATVASLGVEV